LPFEGCDLEGVERQEGNPCQDADQLLRGHEKFAGAWEISLLTRENEVLLRLVEGVSHRGEAPRGVLGDDDASIRKMIEDRGGAAVETRDHGIDPVVPDPLPEEVGVGPGDPVRCCKEKVGSGDDLGARNDGQVPTLGRRSLSRRVEPSNRIDPVPVQRDPGGARMRGTVHVHDSSADGEIPRIGRGGEPGVPQLAEASDQVVPVDLLTGRHPEDRGREHVRRNRLFHRRLHRAHNDRRPVARPVPSRMKEAIEDTHPVMDGDRVGRKGFVRGDFPGREQERPFRSEIGGDFPEHLLRSGVRRGKAENGALQPAGERRDKKRPRTGRHLHRLYAGGARSLREGARDMLE
jgi:hypothetical protein